jgi:hypothetical protein
VSFKIVVAFLVLQTCPRLGWIDPDNGAEAPRDVKVPNGLGRVKGSRAERAGSAALDPACARWGRASRARGGRRLRRELRTPAGSLDEGVAAAPSKPLAGDRPGPRVTEQAGFLALGELRKPHPSWGPKKLRARLEVLGDAALPPASAYWWP